MKKLIKLIKIGKLDQSILNRLKNNLDQNLKDYDLSFDILFNDIKLSNSEYNSKRKQYYAPLILDKISSIFQDIEFFRIIGVMNKDIYLNGYNFIFGIANNNPGVGLISIARLRESFYKKRGLISRKKESWVDIELRILKEVIHELGHTFGLDHCENMCVMKFSDSLNDTDQKPATFCNFCSKRVKGFLK